MVGPGEPVPKGGGAIRVGAPYVVAGRLYVPQDDPHYRAEGLASWYGDDFHGRFTANGEIFDLDGITAAHPTLPLPSYVRVTNLHQRPIADRARQRPRALCRTTASSTCRTRAAQLLGFYDRGTATVRVEYVGRAPIEGSDDRILEATLRENEPAPAPWNVRLASPRSCRRSRAAAAGGPAAFHAAPATTASSGPPGRGHVVCRERHPVATASTILNGRGLY